MNTLVPPADGDASPRLRARLAGLFYLLTGGTGFAFFVRGKLIVAGDAAATAARIHDHEGLFRAGIAADLLGVASYLVVVTLLYGLFEPAGRGTSRLAACFGLAGCTMQAFACAFELGALMLLPGAHVPGGADAAFAYALLRVHAMGFDIAIVFFGFYCLLIGVLVLRSDFMPKVIGALMALGGLGYVGLNLAMFLALPVAHAFDGYVTALGGLAEGVFMLWLLVMGVDPVRWRERARVAA